MRSNVKNNEIKCEKYEIGAHVEKGGSINQLSVTNEKRSNKHM
jgi:hypothetical protein